LKTIFLFCACVLPIVASEPEGYKYWSAADLKGLAKTLAPKINAQKVATERVADFGNHYILAAHREGSGEAEFHETEADIFVVQSGTATLIVGGQLQNGKTTAPGEMRAPSIEGGSRQKLSAGDIVHIPPKTAHQVLLDSGRQFNYFVVKVKQ
jgi:mannose-6-phosphate isomerase-like protein (cupin superfamily)